MIFFLPDQNWSCLGGSLWSWWPRWPLHGGDPKVGSWGESSWRGQIVFRTPHETPRTCCLSFIFLLLFTDRLGDWTECPSFLQSPNSIKELTQDRGGVVVCRNDCMKKLRLKKNTYTSACALSQLGQALSPTFALLI